MTTQFAAAFEFDPAPGAGPPKVRLLGAADAATVGHLELVGQVMLLSGHPVMSIDLGGLTFMDCAGYDAIRRLEDVLAARGRMVKLVGWRGQPGGLRQLLVGIGRNAAHRRCRSHHAPTACRRDSPR